MSGSESSERSGLGSIVRSLFRSAKAKAAAIALGAGLSLSGCYVLHGPYAELRIDTPRAESGHVSHPPATVLMPPVYSPAPAMMYGECHTFAASAADSMHTGGRRVMVCTCYPTENPHDAYPCEIAIE
ncbi:hypothetical protein JW898_00445 [Candidatus Woesearchaeota archaeon]|nr:hypothetical protein [Candidatus Woesearchaeota archaeon]